MIQLIAVSKRFVHNLFVDGVDPEGHQLQDGG